MPTASPLPEPEADALLASDELAQAIALEIDRAGGFLPFSRFMELALYRPASGYYMAGMTPLGGQGDFTTAPELTPLFGRTLAHQIAPYCRGADVLELGAGTGRLAADVLVELRALDALPRRYRILEVSPSQQARAHATLSERAPFATVEWLDRLPEAIEGVVLANEILDAVPCELIVRSASGWLERGVVRGAAGARFGFADRAPSAERAAFYERRLPAGLETGYVTEVNPAAEALVASVSAALAHGLALWIDYGFPRAEYYHPDRSQGTLVAHYRHRVHSDVLKWPGLQDLTAHVDFSAMAEAARAAGCDVLGYTSQARFLLNAGIADRLAGNPEETVAWLAQSNALMRLVSEAEMGELFKVLAVGRGVADELAGFEAGDRRGALLPERQG